MIPSYIDYYILFNSINNYVTLDINIYYVVPTRQCYNAIAERDCKQRTPST